MPPLTFFEPARLSIPAPPLNGSSLVVVPPGGTCDLSSLRAQWIGDPAKMPLHQANWLVPLNGAPVKDGTHSMDGLQ